MHSVFGTTYCARAVCYARKIFMKLTTGCQIIMLAAAPSLQCPGTNITKLFFPLFPNLCCVLDRVFVPGKTLRPSLMFAGEAEAT